MCQKLEKASRQHEHPFLIFDAPVTDKESYSDASRMYIPYLRYNLSMTMANTVPVVSYFCVYVDTYSEGQAGTQHSLRELLDAMPTLRAA